MSARPSPRMPSGNAGFFVGKGRRAGRILLLTVFLWGLGHVAGAEDWLTYSDPEGRFAFDYPAAWGKVSSGTNDGQGRRVAALRFSRGPAADLGGELVLTRGRAGFDLQLLGGLYDPLALEAVPPAARKRLEAVLPRPILHNFCALLEKPRHLNPRHRLIKFLPSAELEALKALDALRNENPVVHRCEVDHHTVTFHKEATFRAGREAVRQHLFGAVRFLKNAYSSFQIVSAGTAPPDAATLERMRRVVSSGRFAR